MGDESSRGRGELGRTRLQSGDWDRSDLGEVVSVDLLKEMSLMKLALLRRVFIAFLLAGPGLLLFPGRSSHGDVVRSQLAALGSTVSECSFLGDMFV